jgi:type IV secretory pathway TraG/TraD family ATPase VirD4
VRRGAHEVRDVQNIADILVDPEGALERRNHWEKTSHALLVGAILHVLYAGEDKTLRGVANFLSDPASPFELTLHRMMTTPHLVAMVARIRSSLRRRAKCSTRATTSVRACCPRPCRSSACTATPRWPKSPRAATGASPT